MTAPEPRPAARAGEKRQGAGLEETFVLLDNSSGRGAPSLLFSEPVDVIAAWTPENVAWVDDYLRLGGRITEEDWLDQAGLLAREGPSAARRVAEEAV